MCENWCYIFLRFELYNRVIVQPLNLQPFFHSGRVVFPHSCWMSERFGEWKTTDHLDSPEATQQRATCSIHCCHGNQVCSLMPPVLFQGLVYHLCVSVSTPRPNKHDLRNDREGDGAESLMSCQGHIYLFSLHLFICNNLLTFKMFEVTKLLTVYTADFSRVELTINLPVFLVFCGEFKVFERLFFILTEGKT